MDIYKVHLKKNGIDPSQDTRIYKLLLQFLMNRKVPWKKALEDKKAHQVNWAKAMEHFKSTLLYKYLYYWMYIIKGNKSTNSCVYLNYTTPYNQKENRMGKENKILRCNFRDSLVLKETTSTINCDQKEKAHNKYKNFMKQELNLKKMKAKRVQTLLTKGLKGFRIFIKANESLRKTKNKIIEDCILAFNYYDHKQRIKALLSLKQYTTTKHMLKYNYQETKQKTLISITSKYFNFWLKRFSNL